MTQATNELDGSTEEILDRVTDDTTVDVYFKAIKRAMALLRKQNIDWQAMPAHVLRDMLLDSAELDKPIATGMLAMMLWITTYVENSPGRGGGDYGIEVIKAMTGRNNPKTRYDPRSAAHRVPLVPVAAE